MRENGEIQKRVEGILGAGELSGFEVIPGGIRRRFLEIGRK
jgi:hypothetical protein